MRNNHWLVGLFLCLAFILQGHKVSFADQKTISLVFQGDSEAVTALEQALKGNPNVTIPGTHSNYSLMVIKPDSTIDYKIVEITPDPSVGYKITIVDPESGRKLNNLTHELGEALREILQHR